MEENGIEGKLGSILKERESSEGDDGYYYMYQVPRLAEREWKGSFGANEKPDAEFW